MNLSPTTCSASRASVCFQVFGGEQPDINSDRSALPINHVAVRVIPKRQAWWKVEVAPVGLPPLVPLLLYFAPAIRRGHLPALHKGAEKSQLPDDRLPEHARQIRVQAGEHFR